MITQREADVLLHTSSNGRFVTDEAAVIAMGAAGLLYDHGPQALAGGAHYLVMTAAGRAALNEWQAAQPQPAMPRRRRVSRAFEAWQSYRDGCSRISFSEFWKTVWPEWRHRI